MSSPLDPRLTFDRLRVGPHNRHAVEVARRLADGAAPAADPLVIHGPGGAGKTHLLVAAGHRARGAQPAQAVRYHALAEWAARGGRSGSDDAFPEGGGLLLLDDVDALEGLPAAQLQLLRILGLAQRAGMRVVATSARPPAEMEVLDPRLRDRLVRGEAVGLAFPGAGLTEAADGSGASPPEPEADEFGAFLSDISSTVAELVEAAPWRRGVEDAVRRWGDQGFRTRRLEAALDGAPPADVEGLIAGFAADAEALLRIERELGRLDPDGALGRPARDPDRLREAEQLLASARSTAAPLPPAPVLDPWFFNREKIALGWVGIGDRIVEEWG